MQCACAKLSSVACPALQDFFTLSYKWKVSNKDLLNIKCAFKLAVRIFRNVSHFKKN